MKSLNQKDIEAAVDILKKVEKFETNHDYQRFLFIVAIVGIIAIFEGFLAYIIERYLDTNITKVYIGYNLKDDPILFIGAWIIQIAIFSSLIIYGRSSKGLLDTWSKQLEKLGLLWGFLYISSFLLNVFAIQFGFSDFGPSIWSIMFSLAFFGSSIIIKKIPNTKKIQFGLIAIGIILFFVAFLLPVIGSYYDMFLLGLTIGISLIILALYLNIDL
ncbi:MAG: hypothetical protein ACFFD1_14465 [Candidatus Thorarchaeota archaeon]